jgi:hypothetical protein
MTEAAEIDRIVFREVTADTWPDFERLVECRKARGQVLQSRIQPNPAFERDAPKAARPSLLR